MPLSRRRMLTLAAGAAGSLVARPRRMAEAGWIWEGQALDVGLRPSIFGLGEGAAWFGLKKVVYMFQPNDELALERMRQFEEVVLHAMKYDFRTGYLTRPNGKRTHAIYLDVSCELDDMMAETKNIVRLASAYRNVTGGFHDDMLGCIKDTKVAAEKYAELYRALHGNPRLKMWSVVYTHELDPARWAGFLPYMDVVNLWVWNSRDLAKLDADLERCREIFPGKAVNLGIYLRDYPNRQPVPMERLKRQAEQTAAWLAGGKITGYSVLASCLIDEHQEQARWLRDFIKSN